MEPEDYIDRVERYLAASGDRRIPEARAFLADHTVFVFPWGRYESLEELVDASRGRYRRINKTYDTWDVVERADGTVVVYSLGTLSGESVHGVSFSSVRYIDRLVFRDGRIAFHQVWNDLGESGVLELRTG